MAHPEDTRPLLGSNQPSYSSLSEKKTKPYGTTDNAPPAYAAADRAPPSYEALRARIREALRARIREALRARIRESTFQFLWKLVVLVVCGTVGYVLIVSLMFLIPVSMIVMGALYRGHCIAEPYIAIYLIVMGSFTLLLALITLVQRCRQRSNQNSDDEESRDRLHPIGVLITCFLLGWFITGNVWIYRTYGEYQWTDSGAADYCDHKFYLFAFWVTTSVYMLFGGLCCCGVVASAVTYCCVRE